MLPLLFMWVCLSSDSVGELSYKISAVQRAQGFAVRVHLEKADRHGWLTLYRIEGPQGGRKVVSKASVDRWQLPRTYELSDEVPGQFGWSYEVVWEPASRQVPASVLATYWPYGRLPQRPTLMVEDAKRGVLRCDFAEAGSYLMRGYNRFGEEVFTVPIEVAQGGTKRYLLPELPKGRYLVRILEPTAAISLAEVVLSL